MKPYVNRITELLGIQYPIIQGGMRWVARAELVAAVGNAGGLGFISAHTHASADALAREIDKVRSLTDKPFGVNLTVLGANAGLDYDAYVRTIVSQGVQVVETAGSNPAKYIAEFKAHGVKVVHKCVTVRHAVKAESLGADALSIDGFECAGHPGEDDIPGLILIPAAADKLKVPILASGGFADGRGLMAALALGADGINMGTRFMLTQESQVHPAIKQRLLDATERDTVLVGRSIGDSSRVVRNSVSLAALELERSGHVTHSDLYALTGANRWMDAFVTGEVEGGAFPAGIVTGLIHDLPTCAELIERIVKEAAAIAQRQLGFGASLA
ncbi:NAD(P)H-dependent flavin oxidoreductase [Paraburkholderia diazotrophica]|uniref:2-nitropropane dioxygenase n=1 Tax=Paraburkholderia diazotrophica TaxID=667676 RepID=A0A1H7CKM4_9BURK|nr:nitronate monooxygenase [Paraburkholderia diazotrophica]SEJ90191.1 2-nitropropane dioxygenase precursor [Paraburkholderia diazotrophica]